MITASMSPEVSIPNPEYCIFVQTLSPPPPPWEGLFIFLEYSPTVTEDLLAPITDFLSFRINIRHWLSRYFADTQFS